MAFGKKQQTASFNQSNVSMLASEALAKARSTQVQLAVRLTGETPLLMHRWSQKAIIEMVGKMVGQPQPRGSKNITDDYNQSYYRNLDSVVAMPCRIVKACIIEGAIATSGVVSKAELKRGLRVVGYTSPISVKMPMRMDCQIASNNGTSDMRTRAVIPPGYHFDIVLQFGINELTPDKVISALDAAGSYIGLCDWRPQTGGEYGTFSVGVLPDTEIARILKSCSIPEEMYEIPPEFLTIFNALPEERSDYLRKSLAVMNKVNGDAAKHKNGAAKVEKTI